jgi:hypothetical protein
MPLRTKRDSRATVATLKWRLDGRTQRHKRDAKRIKKTTHIGFLCVFL